MNKIIFYSILPLLLSASPVATKEAETSKSFFNSYKLNISLLPSFSINLIEDEERDYEVTTSFTRGSRESRELLAKSSSLTEKSKYRYEKACKRYLVREGKREERLAKKEIRLKKSEERRVQREAESSEKKIAWFHYTSRSNDDNS
jgi:hypothetical protein